ncbi:MAG: Bax inhibitor-1 family protein [Candidatus Hodarchaeales archaeon]|jgi:FtsH-binding integral membrane protein
MVYRYERPRPTHEFSAKDMVYRHLSLALFLSFTVVGAMVLFDVPIWVYYIGSAVEFGIIILLVISSLFRQQFSESTALLILNVFAVATGITLGMLVKVLLILEPIVVVYAFGTAGITVFSMFAYTSAQKPDVAGWYKPVMIITILFLVFAFLGMFIFAGSPLFYLIVSGFGAFLFAIFLYMDLARLSRNEFHSPAMMALWLFYDIIFLLKYLLMFFYHLVASDN